jgi:hypothetical protein
MDQLIETKVSDILTILRKKISEDEDNEITNFYDRKEYGLALQTACAICLDKEILIEASTKELFINLYKLMDGDNDPDWKSMNFFEHILSIKTVE